MSIDQHQLLRDRTKKFALRINRLSQSLPTTREANVLGGQLLHSGTAVAANYRAAGRSRSRAEFVSRIGVVVEEADETVFWLELLVESCIVSADKLAAIMREANELLAIFSVSRTTAKR